VHRLAQAAAAALLSAAGSCASYLGLTPLHRHACTQDLQGVRKQQWQHGHVVGHSCFQPTLAGRHGCQRRVRSASKSPKTPAPAARRPTKAGKRRPMYSHLLKIKLCSFGACAASHTACDVHKTPPMLGDRLFLCTVGKPMPNPIQQNFLLFRIKKQHGCYPPKARPVSCGLLVQRTAVSSDHFRHQSM
jgi:hypothetical protein